jgi:hypothetical protein
MKLPVSLICLPVPRRLNALVLILLVLPVAAGRSQQITIGRIEQMPNAPSPYLMRNWAEVARGYDSLVFNTSLSGQYLPLISVTSNGVNYPGQSTFGMQSYVGSSPGGGEGINCLPAVIGASLVGIDKSSQNGTNWVQMCREWFNKANGQNVYLNTPRGQTGDDWWYETMPNVFFYQLYSMYPGQAEFGSQFVTVADRWLAAVKAMGGSTTPWSLANVNHRAFNLMTMTPNNTSVPEPEAAGAIAWILYMAYVNTGNPEYRIGAELALESLLVYLTNPSYELQLPYGAFVAARMNAELGTTYDVKKMLEWCFSDGNGTLRQWGAIVGNWGGYDCSGLIGEASTGNDYAFFMNGAEQAGALLPLVRYDDRYARAIGKWMVNVANASRLFYTAFLPDDHQDSSPWAHQYDPGSTIAHESIRQRNPLNAAITPFATGDAINGSWAPTNLALYGSSHVGIFGGIVETTTVAQILRLDLLKTDYFHRQAYPTYLYFNPYGSDTSVTLDVGSGMHDVYNTVTKSFALQGVTGTTPFVVPSNSAAVVVVAPAAGIMTFDLDKTLINGIVVDYRSARAVGNYAPRIKSLAPDSSRVVTGGSIRLFCTAADRNGDSLGYAWSCSGGTLSGSGTLATWTAPATEGTYSVTCSVNDGHGGQDAATDTIQVVQKINVPPVILRFNAIPRKVNLGGSSSIGCTAIDANGDPISFHWSSVSGSVSGSGSTIRWTAPATAGNYTVLCRVDDAFGGSDLDSVGLEVRDLSVTPGGRLLAFYPFTGNADDASGSGHNGLLNNVLGASDRFGNPGSAFAFNGSTSSVVVPTDTALNVGKALTVNFWMKVAAFYPSREQYVVSHGSWQNRWKVSISPNTNTLRWTVKNTLEQVKDLDSESRLLLDSLYNVTGFYDGSDLEIYVNGQLDAFTRFSGLLNPTTVNLTIGQSLPGENQYGFNGVLDEIRIYDYGLPLQQIQSFYDIATGIAGNRSDQMPAEFQLLPNFPNPFNPATRIKFSIPPGRDGPISSPPPATREQNGRAGKSQYNGGGFVSLKVCDVLGREVKTLVNQELKPGSYEVTFDASGFPSGVYFSTLQSGNARVTRSMMLIK